MTRTTTALAPTDARDAARTGVLVGSVVVVLGLIIRLLLVAQA